MTARTAGGVPAISDATVRARTGRDWAGWFTALDRCGAARLAHRDIARLLAKRLPGWWAQMVTVEYERARGLRVRHQTATGYSVAVSKTIAAPLTRLYGAAAGSAQRRGWFPRGAFESLSQTRGKYLRGRWRQGRRVEIGFYARGRGRSQIAVQVSRLERVTDVETVRRAWRGALTRLQQRLERPAGGATVRSPSRRPRAASGRAPRARRGSRR